MYKYVIKRLLLTIPILLGVIVLVFLLINIVPGNPATEILGDNASPEAIAALNAKLGYDKPLLQRLLAYLSDILFHFDFGTSWQSSKPVMKEILPNFKYTLQFAILGTILYVLLGVPLGILSAIKQYSASDNILRVSAMLISAMPSFWMALLFIYLFALKLGWLPPFGVETWQGYVLPVAVFGLSGSGGLLRTTRTIMLEAIRQDYVRTARAKGIPERRVIWRHAFRNVTLPLINTVGIGFGALLGGTVLLENIFSLPGLGSLALRALNGKDVPMVMASTIFLSAIFCLIVLVVDIISAYADPRVKAKYTSD